MRCHLGVGEKKVFPSEERKRLRTARGKVAHLFVSKEKKLVKQVLHWLML